MRILTALLATALVTAGCGGSDSPTSAPPPSAPPTLSADAAPAAASASLLGEGDIPDSVAAPAEAPDAEDEALEDKADACVGLTPIDYLAEEQSPSFTVGDLPNALQTSSEATVAPTRDLARAEFTAFAAPKATGCFQEFLKESLADLDAPGVSIALGEVTVRSTPSPKAAGAVHGFEFTATLKGEGITLPVRGVVVFALVSQIIVTVQTTGFGTAAESAGASVDQLLDVVAMRAAGASGLVG